MQRSVISSCHSVTLGFDVEPVDRAAFAFPALTYWPKRARARMAYLSLFPIGGRMRANLMVYRDMTDPWLQQFRQAPEAALLAMMPGLARMTGGFRVSGQIRVRPADLCVTEGYQQPGVVLVGDAFSTSCPAAGTGTTKVFTDVGRLCNVYIPDWLSTEGMGTEKVARFYDDPEKVACEAWSRSKAYHLRSLSTDRSLPWLARRWARFLVRFAQGVRYATIKRFTAGTDPRPKTEPADQPRHGKLA
jgi:2-polyprenyl-6-methoxyphenol hydroxylase-like FAD-dependent oxidoreductase